MSHPHILRWLPVLASALSLCCSARPTPPENSFGSVELPLTTEVEGRTFRLENAAFKIDGDAERQVGADATGPSQLLREALPAGQYTIELLDGWSLHELSDSSSGALLATLESINPVPFTVTPGEATQILFRFAARPPADPEVETESQEGSVQVELAVDWQAPSTVFFSEIMKNPVGISDSKGEWIELSNHGQTAFALKGCILSRDSKSYTLKGDLMLEAGASIALSNGEAPGFEPAEVYKTVTLPNSSEFLLQLTCADELIDQVLVTKEAFPAGNGASLSLSGTHWTAADNDDGAAWCSGVERYNEDQADLGSPGLRNPPCGETQQ